MLALIDGDVLAYLACASRWAKTVEVRGDTGIIRLDENGKRMAVEYTKEEDQKFLEYSWDNFEKLLQELLDSVYCTEYLMAIKGPNNYRNIMYPEYKMNRHADPTKQNIFVPTLRKLAANLGIAIESDGREADDLLRIWAEQAIEAGDDYIVCSIDKDLDCIPGKHYNMKKKELFEVSPETALRFYYEQLLKGDATDNIPGVPGVGNVKATKLLAECTTEEEFQEVVVTQYFGAYGEQDWYQYLLSNGKMIHLQKTPNDYFKISHWPLVKELL